MRGVREGHVKVREGHVKVRERHDKVREGHDEVRERCEMPLGLFKNIFVGRLDWREKKDD